MEKKKDIALLNHI